jgi:hypothetical protein
MYIISEEINKIKKPPKSKEIETNSIYEVMADF